MTHCALCPSQRRPVPSTGPTPCRILFLGEAPSRSEDIDGEPFTGPTGLELCETYLPISGLARSDVHIANAFMCSHRDYHNPTPAEAMACASTHLSELLGKVKPYIIVPMGAVACSLFPHINLNKDHGLPIPGKWGAWSGIVFPTYHPTMGMRQPTYMIPLTSDFNALGVLYRQIQQREVQHQQGVRGNVFDYPTDPYPTPDYQVIRTEADLEAYVDGGVIEVGSVVVIGEDTESLPDGSPYCVTFSLRPGTGRLIYTHDTHLTYAYRALLVDLSPLQIFHNYLHDVVQFERLSLPIDRFMDTMVRAYNLCLGGGGDEEDTESRAGRGSLSLKILSYRHLNMGMTSFKDTVYPWSMPVLLEWLKQCSTVLFPTPVANPNPTCANCGCPSHAHKYGAKNTPSGKCSLCPCKRHKISKPPKASDEDLALVRLYRKVESLIKVLLGKLDVIESEFEPEPTGKKEVDPWKRVRDWSAEDIETLTTIAGSLPVPSIVHVPEKELLNYACRDCDATLRLYLHMRNLKPWIFY